MNYKAMLLERRVVAKDTVVLILEKPKNFIFIPGQYIDVGLLNTNLEEYERFRSLSIGSVPQEEFLLLSYRSRPSQFKQRIDQLPLGADLEIQGPLGRFILYPGQEPVVFLAGGIGVVPFLAIIKSQTLKKSSRDLDLFYSSSSLNELAFLQELTALERENPHFKFIPTLTAKKSFEEWKGQRGYIDSKMIKNYLADFKNSLFYIAGTPDMVMDLRFMVTGLGVNPAQIKTESFDGY